MRLKRSGVPPSTRKARLPNPATRSGIWSETPGPNTILPAVENSNFIGYTFM